MYHLRVEVEEVKGFCDSPMEAGDYFEVKDGKIIIPDKKGICMWALQSMMAFFPAKMREIDEENDWISHTERFSCPDPNGQVIFKISRIDPVTGKKVDAESKKPPARILVDPSVCSGCRVCESACSFVHYEDFNPLRSRIKVKKDERQGDDIPFVCRQCGDAPCVNSCPTGALSRDENTNAVLLDKELCIECGKCAQACPFDAVNFLGSDRKDQKDYPYICDLCGGNPECVSRCPTGALQFGLAEEKINTGGA